jgi:hypothetical protein
VPPRASYQCLTDDLYCARSAESSSPTVLVSFLLHRALSDRPNVRAKNCRALDRDPMGSQVHTAKSLTGGAGRFRRLDNV